MTSAMMMMMSSNGNARGGNRDTRGVLEPGTLAGHEMGSIGADNYTLCNLDSHTYLHISSYDPLPGNHHHGNRDANNPGERSTTRAEGGLGGYHGYHGNQQPLLMRQHPVDYDRYGRKSNSYHFSNNSNNNNNRSHRNNDADEQRDAADSSTAVAATSSTKDETYQNDKDNKDESFDNNSNDNDSSVVIRVIAPEDETCEWRYKDYNSSSSSNNNSNNNNNNEISGRHIDSKMNLYQPMGYPYEEDNLSPGSRLQAPPCGHLHGNDLIHNPPPYYGDRELPIGFFAAGFQAQPHQFSSSDLIRAAYNSQLSSSPQSSTCLPGASSSSANSPQVTTTSASQRDLTFSGNSAFVPTTTASTSILETGDNRNKLTNKHGFSSTPTPSSPQNLVAEQRLVTNMPPPPAPAAVHPFAVTSADYPAFAGATSSSYYYPYPNSLPVPLLNPSYNTSTSVGGGSTIQQVENSIFTPRYFTNGGPVSPISPAQFYTQYHPHSNSVDSVQSVPNPYPHQTHHHHSNHPHQLLYADRAVPFGGLGGVFGVEGARGIVSSNIYPGFQAQGQGSLRNGLPSPPTFLMGGSTLDGGGLLGSHFSHHPHLNLPHDHQLVTTSGSSSSSSNNSSNSNPSGLATYKWMTVKRGSPRTSGEQRGTGRN